MKQKIILAVSVFIGLLAAFLSGQYLASRERALDREREALERQNRKVEVVVLAKALPAGTKLKQSDLGILSFPEKALRGQVIRPEGNVALRLVGKTLAMGVEARKPLLWSDIEGGSPETQGVARKLHPKMRALSITVSGATSVSHMVRPTDRVDVLGTFSMPSKTSPEVMEVVTLTVLQDVLVLAVGQETDSLASTSQYNLVTLEVSPHEAEVLTFTEQMRGRLTLTLRHPDDLYYETALPQVDFDRIRSTLEGLNEARQKTILRKR